MSRQEEELETPNSQRVAMDMVETEHDRGDPLLSKSNGDQHQPIPSSIQRFSGILYGLLSAFLFTCSTFVAKQLKVDLFDALLLRFLLQTILSLIYMKCIKHYVLFSGTRVPVAVLQSLNCFLAVTGFLAFFLGYRYLSLPELTTIRYTQVIWTAVIGTVLYRERPSVAILLAIVLTTVGVSFVAQPEVLFGRKLPLITNTTEINSDRISTDRQRLFGLLIALYCSIALSLNVLANKRLLTSYQTKPSLLVFHFTSLSFCVLFVHQLHKYYRIVVNHNQSLSIALSNNFINWNYFIASIVCCLQIIASVFIQKSIKREHPSVFTVVQSSDILFSLLLQNIFTSNRSNFISLVGSILVLSSILIVGGYKFIHERKERPSAPVAWIASDLIKLVPRFTQI